jgi:hypothetical protein
MTIMRVSETFIILREKSTKLVLCILCLSLKVEKKQRHSQANKVERIQTYTGRKVNSSLERRKRI